jgi:hypothetical protein
VVKKCFQGLWLTALMSAEGKKPCTVSRNGMRATLYSADIRKTDIVRVIGQLTNGHLIEHGQLTMDN